MSIVSVQVKAGDLQYLVGYMHNDAMMRIASIPAGATVIEAIGTEGLVTALRSDPKKLVTIVTYDDGKPMECTVTLGTAVDEPDGWEGATIIYGGM